LCDGEAKCTHWSFVPKRKFCFLLSSCDKKDDEGVVSGAKGCKPPSKMFTVRNLVGAELTDCVAKWEPSDVCPDQDMTTDKKIAKDGNAEVTYYAAPPSLGCTKLLKTTVCKWGTEDCLLTKDGKNEDIEVKDLPTSLYVKKQLADAKKCEMGTDYKVLLG